MTRKQVLHRVLEIVTDEEIRVKIAEIIDELPLTGWSEKTIFDTINQFIVENGRAPSLTDFKSKGLPPHPVIKLRFGMTLREFMNTYYPKSNLCSSKIYRYKTKEEWKQIFLNEYFEKKPLSANEYNRIREVGTPSWATVAKMFGVTGWLKWLEFCEIAPCTMCRKQEKGNEKLVAISVTSEVHLKKGR